MSDLWGEEEDNNPYGSFNRRDSVSSADEQPPSPTSRFRRPATPPSPSFPTQGSGAAAQSTNANDDDGTTSAAERPAVQWKQGGYDSRVEQLLYERPDLQIAITHAGKNVEGGGSYIAYTVRTGDLEVRRRYRDFSSLRTTLVNLHPTLIVPPIPEKHTIADYAAKPTKAKEDVAVIEHRKRMLTSFLNRCRRMQEVREDGVFWKFLDPNASWNEVLHSHPVSSLPKNNLKAPPLDPANPTPGHNWLPIPPNNAKLKSQSSKDSKAELSGTPTSPPTAAAYPSAAAHTTSGPQIFGRFPPQPNHLSEQELHPYFVNFEASSRELETLLQGNMEKVNRRTLSHLNSLAEDMSELGARLNGFSLSEQSATLAAAIEKLGQAVDSTYIATGDMSTSLGASFSDPMRESAQFAGIVRGVLRYRILKRIQSEMTRDELDKKRALLDQLEKSEQEAQRIEEHLERSGFVQQGAPRRSNSAAARSDRPRHEEDNASVDSDFPQGDAQPPPSASQGLPPKSEPNSPVHKKSPSGNFVTNRIFGRINHAFHGMVDVDPERSRRDQIGKTKESLVQLEQAIEVSEKDVKDASTGVMKSLQQFQSEKEDDLRRYMIAYARTHIEWSKRNLASWEEAKSEVDKIEPLQLLRRSTRHFLPFELPAAAQTHLLFTTSSNSQPTKRFKQNYSRRSSTSSTSYDKHSDIFSPEDHQSVVPSPGASPSPVANHTTPPRYIPPHLKEEVLPPPLPPRAGSTPTRAPSDEAGMSGSDKSSDRSIDNDTSRSDRGDSPTASFTGTVLSQLGIGSARAASPAKRSASEFEDNTTELQDVANRTPQMSPTSSRKKSMPSQHASPLPSRHKPSNANGAAGQYDQMMLDPEDDTPTTQGNLGSDMSSSTSNGFDRHSTPTTSTSVTSVDQSVKDSAERRKTLPPFDEQMATIHKMVHETPENDGDKGYLISESWIARVRARTTDGKLKSGAKDAIEGEVGPVDNSDIVRNDHFFGDLRTASGESFIPLRLDVTYPDSFEIVPQQAWDLILEWYGVAEQSHVLTRYRHRTSDNEFDLNFQYELNPPICTIQKLRNDSAGASMASLRQQDALASSIVASRSDTFIDFLKRAKSVAEIAENVKAQLWRLLETGSTALDTSKMPTPIASRGGSPVPTDRLPQTKPRLIVDPLTFTSMDEGTQRERIDPITDTKDMRLAEVGLPAQCTLILDEYMETRDWQGFVSESVTGTANNLGVDLKSGNDGQSTSNGHLKPVAITGSGRRSPTPSGVMTRGRTTRKGKARGTTGLTNLGNTCYMNSALQCIRSVEELSIYFLARKHLEELNADNPLGYNGAMAKNYESVVSNIFSLESSGSFAPRAFKGALGRANALFSGYGQQDSQEFLSFLVDGLHEDLNRVKKKPYLENPESDDKTVHDPEAVRELGETFRSNHKARNDSVAMDLFNGFYKNTMHCPVCDKVSVTFDPFSQLTLQLPIESTFQHRFVFWPLRGQPRLIDVDIDKNSTIRMLKDWIGQRVKVLGENMIICEEYSNKIYQILEEPAVISETNLQASDHLWAVELAAPATNWPPPAPTKKKASINVFASNNSEPLPEMSSPVADRMAVPVLHRVYNRSSLKFDLTPSIILLTREEAKDGDKILRKILQKVQTMTTRNLFDEEHMRRAHTNREDSDTELLNGEDGSAHDEAKAEAQSIEGEDGLVDVHMRDAKPGPNTPNGADTSSSPSTSDILDPSFFIFPELTQLFEIKIVPPSSTNIIPSGLSAIGESNRHENLSHRIQNQTQRRRRGSSSASRKNRLSFDASSSDEAEQRNGANSSFGQTTPPDSDDDPPRKPGGLKRVKFRPQKAQIESKDDYLVRLGEAIVLDWTETGIDQLFGGDGDRGHRSDIDIELVPDPELEEKKMKRTARKKNGISLEECFEETGKTEVLSEDNAWYCGRCKELRRATKKLEIWTAPDILILHLKRFASASRMRDKIDVLVDFPTEDLNLEGKVGLPEGKSLTYDLFAVDNHYGGLGGGHYTAYAQNFFDKQWYEYNDQIVSSTNPESVVTRAAYLLFYRRRSDKPLGGPALEELVEAELSHSNSTTLSGEDSRPGEHLSNGSSDGSHAAGTGLTAGAGAAANHQGADDIGPLNSYRHALADIARNSNDRLDRDVEGEYGQPPAYYDEGYAENDADLPYNSIEEDDGRGFIGPRQPQTWDFANISAPPGSRANSSTMMQDLSDGAKDETQADRIATDFGDDGQPFEPDDFGLLQRHSSDPELVERVTHENDSDEDPPVTEIKLDDDDEKTGSPNEGA